MFKRILVESLKEVADYPLLVRIAFLTGFVETIGSFWRFGYTFYVILERNLDMSNIEGTLIEFIKAVFDIATKNISRGFVVFAGLMGVAGYMILYPIGHGMMIAYSQHKSAWKAFGIAWKRYFTITVAFATLSVFTFGSWHLLGLRYFYARGIMDNILIKIFLILAGLSLIVTTFIYAYANVSTVVDTFESDQPVLQAREALRNSTRIALEYPFITLKFLFLSFILQIRFVVMTLIVIGIPSVLIWLLMQIGIVGPQGSVVVVLVTTGILLIVSMYINSIIDAFFAVYRYKLYQELKEKSASGALGE